MFVSILTLLCGGLAIRGMSEGISDVWLRPRGDETVVNGSKYDITWTSDFASWFPTYCPSCDTNKVDLCVQPFSTRNFNINLAKGININERLRYSWAVDIPAEEVQDANDLVLRFIPFGGSCDGDEEVSSPRFSIEAALASVPTSASTDQNASTPASSLGTSTDFSKNPTASSGAPSTTTDTPAASATPETASPASAGLSTGAKAGIGVGVGLVTVLLLSALLLFLKVKKSREHAQSWYRERTNPEKEITSRHTDPYQDGPQQGSGWSATYKGSGLAKKPNGVPVEQPVQELDGRDMILEADGGRYDR